MIDISHSNGMWEYPRLFHGILSISHNIVMVLSNVMYMGGLQLALSKMK